MCGLQGRGGGKGYFKHDGSHSGIGFGLTSNSNKHGRHPIASHLCQLQEALRAAGRLGVIRAAACAWCGCSVSPRVVAFPVVSVTFELVSLSESTSTPLRLILVPRTGSGT
jgi:hypothetical protein